jgi:prevent-host-death family protein
VFVLSTNQKGAIAEAEIAAAAVRAGIPVLKPVAEHGRYDLGLEIANRIWRVQCKWGALDREAAVLTISLRTSYCTPTGYIRTPYSATEIDLIAVYSGEIDRCYLLPVVLVADRTAISLRLTPPRNGQRASVNLACDYEFAGAVAQLEERLHGMQEAGGSSPPSSTPIEPSILPVGAHRFRNHFGYYLERAAAGDEIHVSRRGKPYARLLPAA